MNILLTTYTIVFLALQGANARKCYVCNDFTNKCDDVSSLVLKDCESWQDSCFTRSVLESGGANKLQTVRGCFIGNDLVGQSHVAHRVTTSICGTDGCNNKVGVASNITDQAPTVPQCYICTSAADPKECPEHGEPNIKYLKSCNTIISGVYDACSKEHVVMDGKVYSKRSCAVSFGDPGCIEDSTKKWSTCTCTTRGCNSGQRTTMNKIVFAVFAFMVMTFFS